MQEIIEAILEDSIAVKRRSIETNLDTIVRTADLLTTCIASGHKILIFGNGGSAADAQHLAAEFVNRFVLERPPLAAMALTTDTSILTSISNDYSFEDVFAKQLTALGKKDDVAWGISTSGNSKNVVKALVTARQYGLATFGMTGRGGRLADCADLVFRVDSDSTARIQETHITVGHILCELVDRALCGHPADRQLI
jgi:D-sedoheptulose 7-phosphate isomerase